MWLASNGISAKRFWLALSLLLFALTNQAQELYVFTEPASNMASKSIGLRLNNSIMKKSEPADISYQLVPEVMFGISKYLMLHADVFLSNRNQSFDAEGASIYGKYRILSMDDIQKHFRMAAFARASVSNNKVSQQAIDLYGQNSGWEAGLVATQLLHKVAISSSLSYIKALDNGNNEFGSRDNYAFNYTLSAGKLMLPKVYKSYKQTNLNLMLEFLSQYNPGAGKHYIDAAPSVQLIFNSQSRIDIGYRAQLTGSLDRMASNNFFIRLEHNLFNVY